MIENNTFDSAVKSTSPRLRSILLDLSDEIKRTTYEIKLRANMPLTLYGKYKTVFIFENGVCSGQYSPDCIRVTTDEIKDTFNRICSYSIHTYQRFINNGYIPMLHGNRAGISGTAVCENGNITNVKDISSINIRISRQVFGAADEIIKELKNKQESIIIAGPPNSGKTTVLRDLIRQLSMGVCGDYLKISVVDERREISAVCDGIVTNDLGISCDVLDSYPKARAIDIAVRTLSPDYIACDEVSDKSEIESISRGVNSGVKFIVTVHAGNEEEIISREQIKELLSTYSFSKLFLLENSEKLGKIKKVYDTRELMNEIYLRRVNNYSDFIDGT